MPPKRIGKPTAALGIDGIVIERIENGIIHGQAAWDGWRPFSISASTGR